MYRHIYNTKWTLSYRFELSAKMREACLIVKNHLNDGAKTVKSKEVVGTNDTYYILFTLWLLFQMNQLIPVKLDFE